MPAHRAFPHPGYFERDLYRAAYPATQEVVYNHRFSGKHGSSSAQRRIGGFIGDDARTGEDRARRERSQDQRAYEQQEHT
jgi:hypothetical protein